MKKNTSATPSQPTKAFLDNPAGCLFHKAWSNEALKTVPSEDKWFNKESIPCYKGVMDRSPSLIPGEIVKSQRADGRRIILIGTRFGNVVVFDRYAEASDKQIFVTNAPNSVTVKSLMERGAVSEEGMFTLLGCPGATDNIGETIEAIAAEVEEFTVAA